MIDYRYHALSLAAVLFALALGVLLGVAIGDSNLVSSAKSGVVHDLDAEVRQARAHAAQLQEQLQREQTFAGELYPLSIHGLLAGHSFGLVFLGQSSDQVDAIVRSSVAAAGGTVASVVAVREPLDTGTLAAASLGTRYAALASNPQLARPFGEVVGHELVSGGANISRSLLSRVRAQLLSAFDGQPAPLEGLVVMRAQPGSQVTAQSEADSEFAAGLVAGAASAGVPAVGVELTATQPSQVPWYRSQRISSVDDVDTRAGQVALVLALDGYRGSFGVKPTAESLLPTPSSGPG